MTTTSLLLKDILNEEYRLSTDPEKVFFDFYVLNYLSTANLDVTSKDYKGGFIGKDVDELKSLIEAAEDKILPSLKEKLLHAVYYSISCEARHYGDEAGYYVDSNDNTIDAEPMKEKYIEFEKYLTVLENSNEDRLERRPFGVKLVRRIFGQNSPLFVSGMKWIFNNLEWSNDYGGAAWADICDGWLRLYNAKSKKDLYVAIDHIYDLQHNNGSVLDKVKSFLKKEPDDDDPEYGTSFTINWLIQALDFKRDIKNIKELLPVCSNDMKKLALMVLKRSQPSM
jgi:hypothetical protein